MDAKDIENYRVESAVEHADALLQSAILAARSFEEELKLTPYQLVLLAQAHMTAAVSYLERGGM